MNNLSLASINLCGGLGNQCFQLCTLLAYAIKYRRNIVLPNESAGTRPETYWNTIFDGLKSIQTVKISVVSSKEFSKTASFVRVSEPHFQFASLPTIQDDLDVILSGYFQSYRYFDTIEPVLMRIFLPSDTRIQHLKKLWGSFVPTNVQQHNCVAMHVRRGDYLQFPEIHLAIQKPYYDTAMNLFDNVTFVIFSDDIEWCKSTWNDPNMIFVPQTFQDHEAFQLMMFFCKKGHIIANSSFSWWAAYINWLNSNKTSTVVAPETWFGPKGPPKNSIHVPGWIVVENV